MMERQTILRLKKLCSTCVTGIYGCQWKKYPPRPNKKKERIWILVLSCAFGISAFWFYCWWALRNDYDNLNGHLFEKTHRWLDWSVILLILTAFIFSYLLLLMILALCHFALGLLLYLHWINKVAILILVLLILLLMIVIGIMWKEEWDTIILSLQVTAPFLHIGAVVGVTSVAWFVIDQFFQSKRRHLIQPGPISQTSRNPKEIKRIIWLNQTVFQIVLPMFYLGVVIILYLIPCAISSPCIIKRENLAPRPIMMGHRGAPMLAPENTLMSFEETVKCEASAFETDVRISYDGVPFLMHDSTFERTTDVAEVFPKKIRNNVSNFTWTEIQKLNAGKWFLKKDPYSTVRTLSEESQINASKQHVCSLAELLDLAARKKKNVLFDLRPPTDPCHPYLNNSHAIVLETILGSPIHHNQILWQPDNKTVTPKDFQKITGKKLDPETLHKENIRTINIRYSGISFSEIRNYAANNISTNLYVVNERWLFSTLWCARVNSVTTNACHIFKNMNEPIWHINPGAYLAIWIITDLVSFLLIVSIYFIHRSRYMKIQDEPQSYQPELLAETEVKMKEDSEDTIL
ncbi:glycerophosphodiester phosphodiesterase domain-containing protein 5-like isoform X2 [Scyliorhinus canicula]|uniref:glycerophosphodiester phosphodiesterase domain-containing protein 5-like isoform X2 n=1 Tax=Scyliorhinus canicula TaxID=7830 RepID=UPI0018F5C3AA|nr:glycerophosphodiester phosphodiesterase domain-containing protein 5-like isoform X2 [Scyliorhinus canicula]